MQALLCIIGTQAGRLDHSHSHQQHHLAEVGEQHHPVTAAHQQATNKQPQAFQRANLIREGRKIEVFHFNYLCTYDLYSPVYNVLDLCISITRATGRELGPGNREFFGPCELASSQQGSKKLEEAHKGGFRAHTVGGGGGLRSMWIKELNHPARAAPPHYKTF